MANLDDFLNVENIDVHSDMGKAGLLLNNAEQKELSKNDIVDTQNVTQKVDFFNLIPSQGNFLGLDISKSSTGWCWIQDGVRTAGNIHLTGRLAKQYPKHKELMMRVELKEELLKLFKNCSFDLIVIEDVFQGANAKTVRLLYDLNTAIDELIYEGNIICKDFLRISNMLWKKWLYQIDALNITKAMTDKPRIQVCMAMLGITETGDGFQDRLDATGMLAGYFLNQVSQTDTDVKRKILWSDVSLRYKADREEALALRGNTLKISDGPIEVPGNILTKSVMEKYLLNNPDGVYITKNTVPIGLLSDKLKAIDGGGYVVFWIRPDKREKYSKI